MGTISIVRNLANVVLGDKPILGRNIVYDGGWPYGVMKYFDRDLPRVAAAGPEECAKAARLELGLLTPAFLVTLFAPPNVDNVGRIIPGAQPKVTVLRDYSGLLEGEGPDATFRPLSAEDQKTYLTQTISVVPQLIDLEAAHEGKNYVIESPVEYVTNSEFPGMKDLKNQAPQLFR